MGGAAVVPVCGSGAVVDSRLRVVAQRALNLPGLYLSLSGPLVCLECWAGHARAWGGAVARAGAAWAGIRASFARGTTVQCRSARSCISSRARRRVVSCCVAYHW